MNAPPQKKLPLVVIVGGGFGGLSAARALKNVPVRVVLIDRTNHHLFQPLLYQAATSILAPSQIATPIRQVLAKQENASVYLAEMAGIDIVKRNILVNYLSRKSQPFHYDYLVLATGATHNYFGHEEFADYAPGLKKLTDATSIRDRILRAFEVAEEVDDPKLHADLLTFVLVGGGPTGVELAGSIAELTRYELKAEFRRVDPKNSRIILVDGGKRILGSFHESLSKAAQNRLQELGVEVRNGVHVTKIDETGVMVGDEHIASRTVIWTAGVKPSRAAKYLNVPVDKAGRVMVQPDCSVADRPGVFVIGDTAHLEENGKPLPGVAQVAMQQGAYVASVIAARVEGYKPPRPFKYFDKGNMAVVGRNFAILEAGPLRMSGFFAWLAWAMIHIMFLASFGNRLQVITMWIWTYISKRRGSRLILGEGGKHPLFENEPGALS
jgi:NADH dehydrogenase FAD-containing subunit